MLGGIAVIITSWNAFILGGRRAIYALAKAKLLPAAFAKLHPKYNTPYIAINFIGVLCCFSPFLGKTILVWLINAGSFRLLLVMAWWLLHFLNYVNLNQTCQDHLE